MDVSQLYETLSDADKYNLDMLADEIKRKYESGERRGEPKGRVILFLGAAANYHAPSGFEDAYHKDDRPPIGNELNNLLIDSMYRPHVNLDLNTSMKAERLPLSYTAQYFEELTDRPRLVAELGKLIDGKKVSPLLKALAEMDFKYVVTTNYDHLFEDALTAAGKEFHKGIYKANKFGEPQPTTSIPERDISVKKPFLYKFHGDIKDVLDENGDYRPEKDSIVLTDEDYLNFILRMGQVNDNKEKISERDTLDLYPIPQVINEAFTGKNQNTFLFIGYGLQDYNLRLIFKTSLWKKDSNIFKALQKWSITLNHHAPIREFFNANYRFTFIDHDIWCAIPYLYKTMFDRDMPL